jgi:hypothetical protein
MLNGQVVNVVVDDATYRRPKHIEALDAMECIALLLERVE